VDPQAIIAALPMLRKLWRIVPPPLRIPLLLVAAAIGIYQFVVGRREEQTRASTGELTEPAADAAPASPARTD
jgi:hypothetical protein